MIKTTIKLNLSNLYKFRNRLKDISPLQDRQSLVLMNAVNEKFQNQGNPDKWEPSFLALKENRLTLIRTKQLLNSLTIPKNVNMILTKTKDTLTFGTTLKYAYYHDRGVTQVKRRFMNITDENLSKLTFSTINYLMGVD